MTMRPGSRPSAMASAAFLTRFRKAWISLSRLPGTGGSEGSNSMDTLVSPAKPVSASRFTWSSTWWMLTGSVPSGRSSPNTSMRSTRLRMRSVSVQMSWASARSSSLRPGSMSWRGAADARQRVLDLVRQHRGEARDRARRGPVGELALDHLRHGALLQHQHDEARQLRDRAREDIDQLVGARARQVAPRCRTR